MSRLVRLSSRRILLHHPLQIALSVLGVAVGVAVVIGIDLANNSSRRAFELSTEAVAGNATHSLTGGSVGLSEEVYRLLRLAPRDPRSRGARPTAAAPVVEAWANLPASPGRTYRLFGIDPFAEGAFRPYLAGRLGGGGDLAAFLTEPGAVLVTAETAGDIGVAVGEPFVAEIDGERRELRLAGLLEPEEERSRLAIADFLVADIATAQELLGSQGRLDRIDLILDPQAEPDALLAALPSDLRDGLRIEGTERGASVVLEMTRAFRLNLSALSLLGLICGGFLIYNTLTFSVVQRLPLIGRLRSLGVTRREVLSLILTEAAWIGAAGALLGLVLGVLLGQGLVHLVTRTLNDLYYVVSVRRLDLDPLLLGKGALLGVGASVLAALAPALEAVKAPPRRVLARSILEEDRRRQVFRALWAGSALIVLSLALLALPSRNLVLSFAAFFLLLVGCALLAPAATIGAATLARAPLGRLLGAIGKMAAGGIRASLSRTAVAIASLMIAVSVTIGVGVMIGSFRGTVLDWLSASLQGDLYISTAGPTAAPPPPRIDRELASELAGRPGVAGINSLISIDVDSPEGPTTLRAFQLDRRGRRSFDLKSGDADEAWRRFEAGEAVLVSEPLAYRRDLAVGSSLTLIAADGPVELPVAGIYYDYGTDRGAVSIGRDLFDRLWRPLPYSALEVFVEPGHDPAAVLEDLRDVTAARGESLVFRPTQAIRAQSLEIFDRTFLITSVLRLLAGIVAFIGVLSALMALALERARELAVLRTLGLLPKQIFRLVAAQTGLMGLIAGLFSLPVGLMMAAVMIYVINRRSFGWTLDMAVDPWVLAQALALALAASLLAGIYPALRMIRSSPAIDLRQE